MFQKIVNWFTGGETAPEQSNIKEKLKEKKVTEVTGVTVTATATKPEPNKHTKKTLEKMTKLQLEELGRSEFGVELDRRRKKEDLIKQLLKEQRQQK